MVVVTVGVLFLLAEMRGGFFSFGNTYPVILIVIGLISLTAAFASTEGHISEPPPAPPVAPATPAVPPAATPPPNPYQGQGQ
jgi:hypothetical protein